jgi:adenine-specific DNA methylase
MPSSSSARLSVVERKALGAFYTPREITEFLATWAIQDRTAKVMDPGCGDAAFLIAAANRLTALGVAKRNLRAQLVGVDMNPDAARTAIDELQNVGVPDAEVFTGSFFSFGNGLFGPALPKVDAIIGNPPYIRYQLFRDPSRAEALKAAARAGVILPQLTSSWAPYVIHATNFLKDGGRFAMVLPGELLHVGYASAVRDYLLRTYSDLTVIGFDEKVFPGALEEVVLVLGIKGKGDSRLRVRSLKKLSQLTSPDAVLEHARVTAIQPGQRWLTTLLEQDAIEAATSVIRRAKYGTFGEIARIDIGVVTGANDYFMLTKAQVAEHKLPFTALVPAVSRAVHIQGTRFSVLDWSKQAEAGDPAYLFLTDAEGVRGAVERYVKLGEERGLPQRYKCKHREPWYRVPYVRRPDLFLSYMSHFSPRLVVNEAGATNTNTVHGVFLSDPLLAEPLAAAFLNSATLLSVEIEGRSYGGGVLKLEPGEVVKLLVPRLTPKLCTALIAALPEIDAMVRRGDIDEASVVADRIVLGKTFKKAEIENIRSVLAALRARRFSRSRPNDSDGAN